MASLFELDNAISEALEIALAENVNPDTGEIEQGDFSILESLVMNRNIKLENIGAYIKNLTAESAAIKAEENALAARRKSKERKIERLSNYVADSLVKNAQSRFESPKVEFSFRRSTAVNVIDLEAVPTEFIKVEVEKSADKTKISKLLKAGQEIAGCELLEKQLLQIK